MSINPVLTMPRSAEPISAQFNPRLQAKEGDSCWTTALKVAGVITAIIASIGSFVFLGPIGGIIATLIVGAGGLLTFNSCCQNSAHDHVRDAPALPWHQRLFSWTPAGNAVTPVRNEPHVHVGGGHILPPQPARAWYENWFPFVPAGAGYMDRGNHVPVGQGHAVRAGPGPHVPVGQGHIPGGRGMPPGPGHVPVGAGHGHLNPPGPGHIPVPAGPGYVPVGAGHVPVGRGHRP